MFLLTYTARTNNWPPQLLRGYRGPFNSTLQNPKKATSSPKIPMSLFKKPFLLKTLKLDMVRSVGAKP
jgi:hypothetical protein